MAKAKGKKQAAQPAVVESEFQKLMRLELKHLSAVTVVTTTMEHRIIVNAHDLIQGVFGPEQAARFIRDFNQRTQPRWVWNPEKEKNMQVPALLPRVQVLAALINDYMIAERRMA